MSNANFKWSRSYDECINCGKTEVKHKGNGLCKKCYEKSKYKENPKKYNEKSRDYREKNIEKFIEYSKKYRKENSDKIKRVQKEWYNKNLKKVKKMTKEWSVKHPEKVKRYQKKYREIHPERTKNWIMVNRKRYNKNYREYQRIKRLNDPQYRIKRNISSSINKKLKRCLSSKNGNSTWDFLPYTVEELKIHLEKQFESWMNWGNWGIGIGKWNIDHIKSHSSFNYTSIKDKEFLECWALENLRPLDAIENIKKGNQTLKNINQNL